MKDLDNTYTEAHDLLSDEGKKIRLSKIFIINIALMVTSLLATWGFTSLHGFLDGEYLLILIGISLCTGFLYLFAIHSFWAKFNNGLDYRSLFKLAMYYAILLWPLTIYLLYSLI